MGKEEVSHIQTTQNKKKKKNKEKHKKKKVKFFQVSGGGSAQGTKGFRGRLKGGGVCLGKKMGSCLKLKRARKKKRSRQKFFCKRQGGSQNRRLSKERSSRGDDAVGTFVGDMDGKS